MTRTGLLIALAIAGIVGLVFGIWPRLDLEIARLFYMPERNGFFYAWQRWMVVWRDYTSLIITLCAVPAGVALIDKLVHPDRPLLVPGRAVLFLLMTLALGPGILANSVLKQNWGRPRPIDVVEFKGADPFVAWWDTGGACPANCSFIGGEPSGAFWTLAPAALAPPRWRVPAYGAALAFGSVVSVARIAAGGHFFSDVVFAGVLTFLIIWIAHGLIYRWPRTRITDEGVERAIARIARPLHAAVGWVLRRGAGKAS